MPRHADRDRRATPFIPACATVNSVCEPQFWFERFIRMAIANSIACNRPITYQTAGNGNVFQQVTHLILAWPSGRCPHRYIRTENDRMTEAKRRVSRKLLKTVTIVVIALAPLIASGSAEAYGGGFHCGGFHGGFGRGGFSDRGFRGDRFRFGGFFGGVYPSYYGGYYPGHYGYGPCYLTVYGTTYCY